MGTRTAGLIGAGAALVLAEVVMAVYVVPAAIRLSGDTWVQWSRTVMQPPLFLVHRLGLGSFIGHG